MSAQLALTNHFMTAQKSANDFSKETNKTKLHDQLNNIILHIMII